MPAGNSKTDRDPSYIRYGWSGVIPSNNHHNSGAFITRNRRQDD
jgi:hypothetical protein